MKPAMSKKQHVSIYVILYKLLFGLSEVIFALAISLFGQKAVHWYGVYVAQELSEDPHDLLVHLTEGVIPGVLAHHTFLVIYLLILGGAKLAGAVGLIYNKYWGVDLLVGLTVMMLPFQVLRLFVHFSITEFIYFAVGLALAAYLVNFKPRAWFVHIWHKVSTSNGDTIS
jgi:uncharacterized membrane protein